MMSDNIKKPTESILKRYPNLIIKRVGSIPNPYEGNNEGTD